MQVNKPNFLIVGAAKSGTTSLYRYLIDHPEVFMPTINKEPKYFVCKEFQNFKTDNPEHDEFIDRSTVCDRDEYMNLFADATKAKARGEASVMYLYYYETAIERIKQELGDIKIIIMLRNPADRAFSAYTHLVRDNSERNSFEKGLEIEEERIKNNYAPLYRYKDLGLYYRQVKAYIDNFTDVKVFLFDDLKLSSTEIVKEAVRFLDVKIECIPKNIEKVYNKSGIPRNKWFHDIVSKPNSIRSTLKLLVPKYYRSDFMEKIRSKNIKKVTMKSETRNYLLDYFESDILKLGDLIDKDLSQWLSSKG